MISDVAIAFNRFGLGARPGETVPADPRRWLIDQFGAYRPRPPAIAAAPSRQKVAGELAAYLDGRRIMARDARAAEPLAGDADDMAANGPAMAADGGAKQEMQAARKEARESARLDYFAMVQARSLAALESPAPFVERLVHFWSNHFAISVEKGNLMGMGGLIEFEAIRPHVLGRFGDMLAAVERHPTMLLYLDQAQSVGPNSPLGARIASRGKRTVGLNENLAREILELHTLGVRTGYDQNDVTEFARALTGRTVAALTRGPVQKQLGIESGDPGRTVFAAQIHEPGSRRILGRSYDQQGEAQMDAVLADLAVHPATARHIATKLARHFTADDPPATLVAHLEKAFLDSGGDLPTVYRALIEAPESWQTTTRRFKTPWDWYVSALRGLGSTDAPGQQVVAIMAQLGQPVWRPGSPAGFDDVDASWLGADALTRRVALAERLAGRAATSYDARKLAAILLPGAIGPATQQALDRAEGPAQALALLLISPEFLRR